MPVLYRIADNVFERFQLKKLRHSKYHLSSKERALLQKHGTRLNNLKNRFINPQGDEEKHFVDVCEDKVEPITKLEVAWVSYCATLEEEERLNDLWIDGKKQSKEYKQHASRMNAP